MAQVRAGVDQVDLEIVALLERRFAYMRAAARIKPDRDVVRDEGRKAQVLQNVLRAAAHSQMPAALISTLWEQLIETSIAYELAEWDRLRT